MATHSSILLWRLPRTEESGGLHSIGSYRIRHNKSDLACMLSINGNSIAIIIVIQFISVAQSCPALCEPILCSMPGLSVHHQLPELMSIELVMPSNHLIFCCPLLLPRSVFPSIRVFSNESALRMRWPKYWSFSFSISHFNEHPGLISFRMDW